MRILIINAHPDYANAEHYSIQLLNYAKSLLPDAEVLELYNSYIPRIDTDMFAAWNGSTEEKPAAAIKRQGELVDQFLNADVVLIFCPLHNFGVTSGLKDYFDNIIIAGKTFKYVSGGGSVGLLDNSKKIAYIQAAGSDYLHDIKYVNLDLAPHYVRSIFSLMGITRINVIRAEGLSLSATDKNAVIAKDDIKQTLVEYKAI